MCTQWRFLRESHFCLAYRNSTGIKIQRPIGGLGLAGGGTDPEVIRASQRVSGTENPSGSGW